MPWGWVRRQARLGVVEPAELGLDGEEAMLEDEQLGVDADRGRGAVSGAVRPPEPGARR
jgi:hypothetical protein